MMSISTPGEVIRNYPLNLLSVRAGDIYHLLGELRSYPGMHSVYAFGQSAHVAFRGTGIDAGSLKVFLTEKGHRSVEITPIGANIEDCFMELMNTQPR